MTQKEELRIYKDFLINLGSIINTGNTNKLDAMLLAVGDYSYARTNSNPGNQKWEKELQLRTLLKLGKII